ncbi:MAG: hypothetical protein K1X31_00355 [Gemmatimonadaceae bacterium]|nr:hypothetical protein [Gemmatimonadaceae bacterium]
MIRRLAPLVPLVLAVACGSPMGVTPRVAFGVPFTLLPGQAASVGDGVVAVRYDRLLGDGRCPPRAMCVWQGDATIAVTILPMAGAAHSAELHTTLEPRAATHAGLTVALVSLGASIGDDGAPRVPRAELVVTR